MQSALRVSKNLKRLKNSPTLRAPDIEKNFHNTYGKNLRKFIWSIIRMRTKENDAVVEKEKMSVSLH